MNLEDLRLWGTVDPDFVAAPGKRACPFKSCTLFPEHEGPHLDAHPASGRIFGLWPNDGPTALPEDVSEEAVRIVQELNRLRDEYLEARGELLEAQGRLRTKYAGTSNKQVKDLIESSIFPRSEYDIEYSGTEGESVDAIREELVDILGLNGEEED